MQNIHQDFSRREPAAQASTTRLFLSIPLKSGGPHNKRFEFLAIPCNSLKVALQLLESCLALA